MNLKGNSKVKFVVDVNKAVDPGKKVCHGEIAKRNKAVLTKQTTSRLAINLPAGDRSGMASYFAVECAYNHC